MNFLAHYRLAAHERRPAPSPPAYVLGNALPDLLPLAAPRTRLRLSSLAHAPADTDEGRSLLAGVRSHLETDAAFHKSAAFAQAQTAVGLLVQAAGFEGMRVRRFFLAHVLVELALDAVLLRTEPTLAGDFYSAFAMADLGHACAWVEMTVRRPLPGLPAVLSGFSRSRYLQHYTDDAGLAEGINRLCARARQDTFEGANEARLVRLVAQAVPVVGDFAQALMAWAASPQPPTTEK